MFLSVALLLSPPALAFPAQRTSPFPRPAVVWVDDDFGPGTSGWGRTRFATIADGVLHVTAGGRVEVAAGNYPEALVLTKRVHLEGEGPLAATIVAVPGEPNMITIHTPDTSVRGFRFQNDGETRNAILVSGGDRCRLQGNELVGGGLAIQVWPYTTEIVGGVIADNLGVEVLHVGIAGYYPARGFRIEGNHAHQIRLDLGVDSSITGNEVDALSPWPPGGGIQLHDCTACEARENTVLTADAGIELDTGSGNSVVANRVEGQFYTGISGRHEDDLVIRDNVLAGEARGRGIRLSYTDGARVLRNQVTMLSGSAGLFLVECESAQLEENSLEGAGLVLRGELPVEWDSHLVTGNTLAGRPIHYEVGSTDGLVPPDAGQVILAYCSGFTVEDLLFPPGGPGVQLAGCSAGIVRGCTFLQGGPNALYGWECEGLELSGNAFLDAPQVLLDGSASTVQLEHCRTSSLRDNYLAFTPETIGTGMELLDCESLEITGNTIADYSLAVLLRYGPGGHVLHGNSFCAYQSVVDDCDSAWDDGLGSGNYWDDYVGTDEDGDGVGDTPYLITYGLQDDYPLMSPPGGAVLWSDRHVVSAAAGGTSRLVLEAGRGHAGQHYLVLGSASGTSPGIGFGGMHLPLVPDAYFFWLRAHPDAPGYVGFLGTLDQDGRAEALLTLPPDPGLAGTVLHHAACVFVLDGLRLPSLALHVESISNAVPLHVLD